MLAFAHMVTAQTKPSAKSKRRNGATLPRLEQGDRLTAAEFLRRFELMPDLKKAELINGIVFMPSPVRITQHGIPDNLIQGWLLYYVASTPGTQAAANSTVRFDADNVPQPDALLMIEHDEMGGARIGADGYLHGAPELVVEIAASSAALDLHDKLHAYRRAGVKEYIVWRTEDKACDWFFLEDDRYLAVKPDRDGVINSQVFPGLSLDVAALLRRDAAALLARLGKTMHKAAHKLFVARLAKAR